MRLKEDLRVVTLGQVLYRGVGIRLQRPRNIYSNIGKD